MVCVCICIVGGRRGDTRLLTVGGRRVWCVWCVCGRVGVPLDVCSALFHLSLHHALPIAAAPIALPPHRRPCPTPMCCPRPPSLPCLPMRERVLGYAHVATTGSLQPPALLCSALLHPCQPRYIHLTALAAAEEAKAQRERHLMQVEDALSASWAPVAANLQQDREGMVQADEEGELMRHPKPPVSATNLHLFLLNTQRTPRPHQPIPPPPPTCSPLAPPAHGGAAGQPCV